MNGLCTTAVLLLIVVENGVKLGMAVIRLWTVAIGGY